MDLAHDFLAPQNTTHRQYEALRAYFVEQLPAAEVAERFGYTVGSFHQLAHQFRNVPERQFFVDTPKPGVKADRSVRQKIIQLRKQNLSIYDISRALEEEDIKRSSVAVGKYSRRKVSRSCRDARRRTAHGHSAYSGRSGRRACLVAGTTHGSHQVRRLVSVSADARQDGIQPGDRTLWPARHEDGPGRLRHAKPAGLEAAATGGTRM